MKTNHNSKLRSALALLLAVLMVAGNFGSVFANETEDKTINYVSIGDSMTNGYGLDGYFMEDGYNVNGLLQEAPKAYPVLFQKYLAEKAGWDGNEDTLDEYTNLIQLGVSGFRAEEVWRLLEYGQEDAYNGDSYSVHTALASDYSKLNNTAEVGELPFEWSYTKPIESIAELYQKSIEEADVISIALGYNNLGTFISQNFMNYLYTYFGMKFGGWEFQDYADMDAQYALFEETFGKEMTTAAKELYAKLEEILEEQLKDITDPKIKGLINMLVEHTVYSYMGYLISYVGIFENIARINPDADIVLVEFGNALSNFNIAIPDVGVVDFGEYFGYLTEAANTFVNALAATYDVKETVDEIEGMESAHTLDIYSAVYTDDGKLDLVYTEIADANFEGYDVLRQRMVESISGTIFGLAKDSFDAAIENAELAAGLDTGIELASITLGDVEAYEAYIKGETDELNLTSAKIFSCAMYLAFEKGLIEAASLEVVDASALMVLTTEGGLDQVFKGIAGSVTGSLSEEAIGVIVAKITDSVKNKGIADVLLWLNGAGSVYNTEYSAMVTNGVDATQAAMILYVKYVLYNGEYDLTNPDNLSEEKIMNSLIGYFMMQYSHEIQNMLALELGALLGPSYTDEGAVNGPLADALIQDETVMSLFHLYAHFLVGDGIGCHPSNDGYAQIFNSMKEAYEEGYTSIDYTYDELLKVIVFVGETIMEYGDDAYEYLEQSGYFDCLKDIEKPAQPQTKARGTLGYTIDSLTNLVLERKDGYEYFGILVDTEDCKTINLILPYSLLQTEFAQKVAPLLREIGYVNITINSQELMTCGEYITAIFGINKEYDVEAGLSRINVIHTTEIKGAVDETCEEPGYTGDEICLGCGETIKNGEEIPAKGHTEEVIPGKDITCTEPGLTEGKKCSECGEVLVEQEEIPPLGHTGEVIPGEEATCTETGLTEGIICAECEEVLVEQEVIPAKGHTEKTIPGEEATCTETGLTEGIICAECEEVLVEQEVIPAEHKWSEWKHYESSCTENGYDERVCSVCESTEQENIVIADHDWQSEYTVDKEATCGKDGSESIHCKNCEATKDSQVIEATGEHEWLNDWSVNKKPTCEEKGQKNDMCGICFEVRYEDIPALGHTEEKLAAKPATCTATGLTEGVKCSVCDEILKAQTVIAKTGHKEVKVTGKAATCTEKGLTDGKKCEVCKAVTVAQKEIPALGHKEVVDKAVAATCTTTGLTEGKHCETCKTVLVKQNEVAKAGHKEEVIKGKAATCTEKGLTDGKQCTVCKAVTVAQKEIPAKGHTPVEVPAVRPTLIQTGLTSGEKCSVCGEILKAQTEIPKVVLGDVDLDGEVKAKDATQILRYINGKSSVFTTNGEDNEDYILYIESIADVDKDGEVTAKDATQILRFINGKTSVFDQYK